MRQNAFSGESLLQRAARRVAENDARIALQEDHIKDLATAQLEPAILRIRLVLARELLHQMNGVQRLARQVLERELARTPSPAVQVSPSSQARPSFSHGFSDAPEP
jgi:hypothetical protein